MKLRNLLAVGPDAGSVLCLLVGSMLVRLSLTGAHRQYVKDAMGPWLVVAGAVLVLSGLVGWWRGRGEAAVHHDGCDDGPHHEARPSTVGWLLVLPVLAVFVVAPPSLGSFALRRAPTSVIEGSGSYAPLVGPGPVVMPIREFDERAFDRDGVSFADVPVTLVGFVGDDGGPDGFLLARFQIACCAADGRASTAWVEGAVEIPARDAWVQVTGRFAPARSPEDPPRLLVDSLSVVPEPSDPYESL